MKLNENQQARIIKLRSTTKLNLSEIAYLAGTSRTSVQRVCEAIRLNNIGQHGKGRYRLRRSPKITSAKLSPEIVTLHVRMRLYRRGAKIRGIEFLLSEEECRDLFSSPSYYCGAEPKLQKIYCRQRDCNGIPQNGIDRRDSNGDYVTENCVPACKICNFAKRDLTEDEFLAWIDRLIEFRTMKKGEEA